MTVVDKNNNRMLIISGRKEYEPVYLCKKKGCDNGIEIKTIKRIYCLKDECEYIPSS